LLRSSSIHEPSDPPFRVIYIYFCCPFSLSLLHNFRCFGKKEKKRLYRINSRTVKLYVSFSGLVTPTEGPRAPTTNTTNCRRQPFQTRCHAPRHTHTQHTRTGWWRQHSALPARVCTVGWREREIQPFLRTPVKTSGGRNALNLAIESPVPKRAVSVLTTVRPA